MRPPHYVEGTLFPRSEVIADDLQGEQRQSASSMRLSRSRGPEWRELRPMWREPGSDDALLAGLLVDHRASVLAISRGVGHTDPVGCCACTEVCASDPLLLDKGVGKHRLTVGYGLPS
jgi:hypothetical protein